MVTALLVMIFALVAAPVQVSASGIDMTAQMADLGASHHQVQPCEAADCSDMTESCKIYCAGVVSLLQADTVIPAKTGFFEKDRNLEDVAFSGKIPDVAERPPKIPSL